MKLPTLQNSVSNIRRQTVSFGGVNYSSGAGDGELSEASNMSTRMSPYLSPRLGRGVVGAYTSPTAIYVRDKLAVVDGTDFIYDGKVVGQVTAGEKQIVSIGNKIVIFPDKVYYDTDNKDLTPSYETLTIKTSLSTPSNEVVIKEAVSLIDGMKLIDRKVIIADEGFTITKVSGTEAGYVDLFFDREVSKVIGKVNTVIYPDNEFRSLECSVVTTDIPITNINPQYDPVHVKFGTDYIQVIGVSYHGGQDRPFHGFRIGDAVEISGSSEVTNNKTAIIRNISAVNIHFDANTFTEASYLPDSVKIHRKVPDFTVLCESNNRIWGCAEQTIYGSKLGDPTNFFVFDGLSTDSYAVAVGSDGEFTACTPFSSQILFFKERMVHKLYGTEPDNYRLSESLIAGVKDGCAKSLVTSNDTLFYVALNGVYAYSGGVPQLLSYKLGDLQLSQAVAGENNHKYYLSAYDGTAWRFLVYDMKNNLWMHEDNLQVHDFAVQGGLLLALSSDNSIYSIDGLPTELIEWSATLTEFNELQCDVKGYSRLNLRVECEAGAWFEVFISEDGNLFRKVYTGHDKTGIVNVPILPILCDSFRIKISGKGKCSIKALEREFQTHGH